MADLVELLVRVPSGEARDRLQALLATRPGVHPPQGEPCREILMFVRYDPARFRVTEVPRLARVLGFDARIVEC